MHPQSLEERLHSIILKCGFRDMEKAGLVLLHDFMVGAGVGWLNVGTCKVSSTAAVFAGLW